MTNQPTKSEVLKYTLYILAVLPVFIFRDFTPDNELRMDMLMCMFIVLSLYTFFRMYSGAGKRWDTLLFPFSVFMALFTKGPVGIIIPLVSITVFLIIKGEKRTIGRFWGWKTLSVLLILCGAWFAGVYAEGGSQYLNDLVINQTINRAVDSFHHKEPIYYYIGAIWYSLAPWSFLCIGILIAGLKKRLVTTDLELFSLVIVLSTFGVLSLFSSKLQVYLLPVFPFIAYLSVMWLCRLGIQRWMLLLVGIPACIFCLAFPAIIVIQKFINLGGPGFSPIILFAALILSISGILTVIALINYKLNLGIITMSTGLLFAVFTASFALPKYNTIIGVSELCRQAKEVAIQKGIGKYYYCQLDRAESMDVYLGVNPEMLKITDLYKTNTPFIKPSILFLWNKVIETNDSVQWFMQDKNKYLVGNYYFVIIE